ncbi:hypothetical protein LCGC14_1858710 [marine sediment metagenome]|uniref:NapC/NirT cytochrome c N-terminal domain-containing protein n=1 Tax=marine sediment metagenome TaxID=412755 RepID=A0A0F9G7Z5_9ZZZZ
MKIFAVVLFGIAALVIAVLGVKVSMYLNTPEFCGSCHEMKPFVESWATSAHRTVACNTCHRRSKLAASKSLYKHITDNVPEEFTAIAGSLVSDATCLSSRCHDGIPTDQTLKVDHAIIIGMDAQCTQCHKSPHQK